MTYAAIITIEQKGEEKCYLQITAGNYLKATTLASLHSNSYAHMS